ncbi:growth hormone secretagogue receptor type 1-like [Physella acuta]|uniref:growth hormone secretagogue receptor type 1-like n=1 Tax=Physella acuta TaxID=109671 RepID=UPI0027DD2D95|nr:growth hormone secretagogue receptor type 1-like [Physella acuta]
MAVPNDTITPTFFVSSSIYIPPLLLDFFMVFNLLIFGEIVGVLGIVGNIINIIVFYKQGLKDSVNISLAALALSDIGSLMSLQIINVMLNPWFISASQIVRAYDFVIMVAFYPHNYFIRVCGFITAFVSLERCLCVVAPLKVKRIMTPRVAVVVNVLIFTVTLLDMFPVYYTAYLDWKFYPGLNRTMVGMVFRQNPYLVYAASYIITDLFIPYFTFFVIITSTVIIGIRLSNRALWRQSVSKVTKADNVSTKEKKVVVMLVTVTLIFIVCLLPQSAFLTATSFVPGLVFFGTNSDLSFLCYCMCYLTETVSSSVNIVVYYRMSGRYRETLVSVPGFRRSK